MTSVAPMYDDGGAVLGAVLVFRDVSGRKRAEEDRARLAAIVESSDDAIVGKTLDGVITSWNAGAERVFGHTAAESVGQSITLIIPPERLEEERRILEMLRRGERIDHFETVRVSRDGRRLDISLTVSPIRDEGGRLIGASKVARDVTERKRAERVLAENQAQLARALDREREQGRLLRQVAEAALTIHSSESLDGVLRVVTEESWKAHPRRRQGGRQHYRRGRRVTGIHRRRAAGELRSASRPGRPANLAGDCRAGLPHQPSAAADAGRAGGPSGLARRLRAGAAGRVAGRAVRRPRRREPRPDPALRQRGGGIHGER